LDIRFSEKGIFIADLDLWLDPAERCERAWISHAHGDHARGLHCDVFATRDTMGLYRMRWSADDEFPQRLHTVGYGESVTFNDARLTAYPASHILGAAQLLIEYAGERVVYTGDIKLRAPICGALTEVPWCDRLIIESTFGIPVYHFLEQSEARDRIRRFAGECLSDGVTPVFVGYALGRGQEIVHVLTTGGIPTAVHGAIARFVPAYEAAGYACPGWLPYQASETEGKALVVVPTLRANLEARGNMRMAYVSGWAALDNARNRLGAEELIAYSDHADFDELLKIVELSGAREVDVVHGYTEAFAHILRDRGIEARAPLASASRSTSEEAPEG
jgi:Cft2 family RNA processing exonuclease